jgi:Domain of unknown function (DUF4249)
MQRPVYIALMLPQLRHIVFLLPLLALGCEKELEYDVASPNATLVVNSIFAQDSVWQVEVSTTASPGEGSRIRSLKDAYVTILEDGVRIGDMVLDSLDARPGYLGNIEDGRLDGSVKLYFQRTITSVGRAGRNYELRVSHPRYPTVYSTAQIPRQARTRMTSSGPQTAVLIAGKPRRPIEFQILDDGNENYYAIEVWASKADGSIPFSRQAFYSDNKILEENIVVTQSGETNSDYHAYTPDRGVFFSNTKFTGRGASFKVFVDDAFAPPVDQLHVRVLRLSRELYNFTTTYQKQLVNQSNPFSEPAQVFSNIQNGSGIFAGYSVADMQVR